jgi:hypothetical protein
MGGERVIAGRIGSLFFICRPAVAVTARLRHRSVAHGAGGEDDGRAVPFEIKDEGGFYSARMFGVLDHKELEAVNAEVERMEDAGMLGDRLTDLTALERIDVGFEEVFAVALKRAQRPIRVPIRSALVASKPVQFGFARMFQMLNDNPRIQIRIFDSRQAAEQWLRSSRR